jgi:uncharacterized protein DUF1735
MRFLRLPVIACLLFIYSACKKDSTSVDLTPSFYFLNGDTTASAFNNNLILFSSSDTIVFNVILSSTYLLSANGSVTVGVDDNARSAYNSTHGTNYQAMPANAYNFPASVADTISSVYDTIPVTIYKHALDITKNYLLAIRITDADGVSITPDASVIYLHTVNNVLAGIYNSIGTKIMYNGDAADSNINSIDSFTLTKSLVPVDSNFSQIDYADLGGNGWKYYLSFFTDIPGEPPEFTVGVNDVILNSVQSGSFKILSSSYNSTTKTVYIKSSYKNTSGNERIIEENLTLK